MKTQTTKGKVVQNCVMATVAVLMAGGVGFQFIENQKLEKEVHTLSEKHKETSKELKAAKNSTNELSEQNKQLNVTIEKLSLENGDLKGQFEQSQQKLQQAQQELGQAQKELARRKQLASSSQAALASSPSSSNEKGNGMAAEISAYMTGEPGVNGTTASGKQVQFGMIAMAGNFAFGTKVRIHCPGIPEIDGKTFTVEDRGGYIKGNKIDIYVTDPDLMYKIGRRNVQVEILS